MTDLLNTALLIEVSSKLQTAANSLEDLANGNKLGPSQSEAFQFVGELLTQFDFKTKSQRKSLGEESFVVQTFATRPKFYKSLINTIPKLNKIGISSSKDVFMFLKQLHNILATGGSTPVSLSHEKLTIASDMLQGLSQDIMSELNNNGLPKYEMPSSSIASFA